MKKSQSTNEVIQCKHTTKSLSLSSFVQNVHRIQHLIALIEKDRFFGFGYLVGRAPKLGHRTDGLWCVNNLPKVVT